MASPEGRPLKREVERLRRRVLDLEGIEQNAIRFASLVESSKDAIIIKNLNGTVEHWNRGAEELYGYSASEMLNHSISLLLPPESPGEEAEILATLQSGGPAQHFDTVRVRKDGSSVDVSLTISPMRDSAGLIVGASHVARDISDRVRLERSTAQLAAIVKGSDDAIIGKALDGTVQSWNEGAERIYGYPAEEMLGRSMEMLLPADRSSEEKEILDQIRRGGRVSHFETVRTDKHGRPVTVSLTISPVRDHRGEVVGASHVARDVGVQARFEQALAQLAAIVDSSDDGIISKDLNGLIQTWNAGAARIFGYSVEEVIGRPLGFLAPPDRSREEVEILERLNHDGRVEHFETVRVHKDGTLLDVSLMISPIHDKDGRVIGVSHIARDITDQRVLEKELLRAQMMEGLGVLAGGIAHDFNNFLTGILANASFVAETLVPSHPGHDRLCDVIKAAERAAGLTRQLLAYASPRRLQTEIIDLSALVGEISGLIESSIPRSVQLRLELAGRLPPVEVDPAQFQQVIMNLVINAAEAIGKEDGTVVVRTFPQEVDEAYLRTAMMNTDLQPGGYVALEVQDTGCGMSEATIARIFDPFFTTKFTGRGLGLAAVVGITKAHGGAMKVSSTLGSGTTFKVLLPLSEKAAVVVPPVVSDEMPHGSGTVLVVDDEEMILRLSEAALGRLGYSVKIASDGLAAIEIFRADPDQFSLVIIDLTMPGISGGEVFLAVRALRPTVPVLISSGFTEGQAGHRFDGQGISGFLQKPYSARQLAEKVSQSLAGPPSDVGLFAVSRPS